MGYTTLPWRLSPDVLTRGLGVSPCLSVVMGLSLNLGVQPPPKLSLRYSVISCGRTYRELRGVKSSPGRLILDLVENKQF